MFRVIRLSLAKVPLYKISKAKITTNASRGGSFFPFGVYTSLIKPACFTVAVAGGSLLLADVAIYFNKNNRFSLDDIRIKYVDDWIPPHKRVVYSIIAMNAVVFLLKQNGATARIMTEYFTNSIYNRRVSSFMLSCFNHAGPIHLLANMYVLSNFFPHVQSYLGTEKALGLYVGGCAVSSFTSHVVRLALRSPAGSIGASGAICAIVASFCLLRPNALLHPIGLPDLAFSARTGLAATMAIEAALLIGFRGRLPIDFAAHLGGFATGAAYTYALIELSKNKRWW